MKDVTSTSFGLLIGFLLPGLAGLYCTTFWSNGCRRIFQKFLETESNFGLFLLVILAALICGLQISVIRWVIFEKFLCRRHRFDPNAFVTLNLEATLTAFRAAVDEHYRYHQFWGGMALINPFLYWGLLKSQPLGTGELVGFSITAIIIEIATVMAACVAFMRYIQRAGAILHLVNKR